MENVDVVEVDKDKEVAGDAGQKEEASKILDNPSLSSKRKASDDLNDGNKKCYNLKSEVWNHFTIEEGSKVGSEKATCNYCGARYASNPRRNGTSTLRLHLAKCPRLTRQDLKQKTLSFEPVGTGGGVGKLKIVAFSQEECRNKLSMMIIKDELPFRIVKGEGFVEFCNYMNPRFIIPHRVTVGRDCLKIYFDEMKRLKKSLKGHRLCFTTDTWTSIQTMNYMCLTGHWIDKDWNYQKRILNFCQIDNHKRESIGDSIEKCLVQWGIEKILTITVDNAASNDSAIRNLKSSTGYKLKSIISNHEYLHMRCSAHILNLVVRSGLRQIHQSILKIRKAVKYVRGSAPRLKLFTDYVKAMKIECNKGLCMDMDTRWNSTYLMLEAAVKYVKGSAPRLKLFADCVKAVKIECNKGLCMDMDTRWNSTYLMLEAAEKYERAFARFEREDGRYLRYFIRGEDRNDDDVIDKDDLDNLERTGNVNMPPNEDDWINARCFVKFLKIFYEMTKKFSASVSVTSNEFFHDYVHLHLVLNKYAASSKPVLASMATRMILKCDKYWGKFESTNGLLYVAVVLDPRYKSRYVRKSLELLYDKNSASIYADKVDAMLAKLYAQYEERYRKLNFAASTSTQQVDVRMEDDEAINEDDETEDLCFREQWDKQILEDKLSETITDLSKYLEDQLEATCPDFDILNWWKVNIVKYPIMAEIAQDVLAIPVSTVASESAFSTGGCVIDPHRSSLKPKTVEALVCAQNWLRNKQRANDHDDNEDSLEDEKILEELEEAFEREDEN